MQREDDEVHVYHAGEALNEITKEFMQVAMHRDRFPDVEQRSILLFQRI